MAMPEHIPSPDDGPRYTAQELLDYIIEQGGRVHRMPRAPMVFVLTQNPDLARFLMALKGIVYKPPFAMPDISYPLGAYKRHREGQPEWDIYVHTIPVKGEETLWELAGQRRGIPTVTPSDYQ